MKDSEHTRAIAIVGLGAILPDALNPVAFWENVVGKRYSIIETPADRWRIEDYYDPDPATPDKTYSKIGGWVRDFSFDWKTFRIPPKVAGAMDLGQQWAIAATQQALADYGYPKRPVNTERTAVVLGTAMGGEMHYLTNLRISFPEYVRTLERVEAFEALPTTSREEILLRWQEEVAEQFPPVTEDSMPGELPNIVSGRVANVFNLRGPNFITDAACASSFAAIEAAIGLLLKGEVDAVITGGIDRNMGASTFVKFCKIGALSATGTRPFGEGADGFVMGEGAATFLLKRLEDAEREGDRVYAVIRGVGGASDGKGKGITAPNPAGQQLAIQRAWRIAGLDPSTAGLIEAHGTSTRVGDVVEVESLAAIFGAAPCGSIGLGSIKSNIGHLKAGAGAAGLLKATLAIHHRILPPTLNATRPNPNIDFNHTPFYLVHEPQEWKVVPGNLPRRCGVSAYGFGGTNFHLVLEEHVSGTLTNLKKLFSGAVINGSSTNIGDRNMQQPAQPTLLQDDFASSPNLPPRGILALGATSVPELKDRLEGVLAHVQAGMVPSLGRPAERDLLAPERVVIDFDGREELEDRIGKALKGLASDQANFWNALQAQGIFRGRGPRPGKIAFLFPGQGSQYVNMGRKLAEQYPVVSRVFAEADEVMTPILGRPLTSHIFVDGADANAVKGAELDLMQTAITQPAMLTLDIALLRLLESFGFRPDVVMGHSLGEYAALIAAGILPFSQALEAAAARGREMTAIRVEDNGAMAAVMAPYESVEKILSGIDGYVVMANINSFSQSVIGGSTTAVERAIAAFVSAGFQAMRIPVSHAFHTRIVSPASEPLRLVLDRMNITPPKLPLVANVTGDFYPNTVEEIKDLLQQQIASPVQWIRGLETLYAYGARTFVEVGPKKVLKGLVDDVLGKKPEVVSLFTNHPKTGEVESFNQALCGLWSAGYGEETENRGIKQHSTVSMAPLGNPVNFRQDGTMSQKTLHKSQNGNGQVSVETLTQALTQAIQNTIGPLLSNLQSQTPSPQLSQHNRVPNQLFDPPTGSVVITGTGLGLPGAEKHIMDPDNALRILKGEQFVDLIPERFRKLMQGKNITRLIKAEDGNGRFETIGDPDQVIKLAGRPGAFDLTEEYGVPEKLVEALDSTSQMAMAAGLDALREAGIPLVHTYRRTSTGKYLPDRWLLPEPLRDETGVIFASAFPGGDRFAEEFSRYYQWQELQSGIKLLEDLSLYTTDAATLGEIHRRLNELRATQEREPYSFNRLFLFRILAMGHSQFAEYIGARGPNSQINAACASTAQAISIGEDWIRTGRCRRVIIIAADNVTSEHLMEWVGAGFLALGAAAIDDRVEEAAIPFDRRRHGTIMGMGACALVLESEDAVRERGMRGIVELLSSEVRNSAYHGSRLDVGHISQVMDNLVSAAERRFGLLRQNMAAQLAFMSHETFTPARGGSASAEVAALRQTFGDAAAEVVIANTKGFTGHPMGVGVEDVIAVKMLEHGIIPPVPNYREMDPELGPLNLSRGGRYPVQFALHLAAGFGSQIAMTLLRRIPGGQDRLDNKMLYRSWLRSVSGYEPAETEVVKRVLRIKAGKALPETPVPNHWEYGTGPTFRAPVAGDGLLQVESPARRPLERLIPVTPAIPVPHPEPAAVAPAPAPLPVFQGDRVSSRSITTPGAELVVAVVPSTPGAAPKAVMTVPVGIVSEQSPVISDSSPASGSTTPITLSDPIAEAVLEIIAAKTGYPQEMLALDLDLEADLGIDTVKQAETFLAIRERFDIPRRDDLRLRDYPTLAHVIGFVREARPDLMGELSNSIHEPSLPLNSQPPAPTIASDLIADAVLEIIAEKTGYPQDMLAPDLDLEADLGIDTVKQAETFLAIRERFNIPRRDDLRLRDYPTLAHVIGFVREARPDIAPGKQEPVMRVQTPEISEALQAPIPQDPVITTDLVAEAVLEIIAAKTGYPQDMLEPDLDLEADLGIDTVKQAETFLAIRERFDIPRRDDLRLRDYPTLAHVIGFVREARPDLVVGGQLTATSEQLQSTEEQELTTTDYQPPAPSPQSAATLSSSGPSFPRRIPVPVLRPSLEACKATGVTLGEGSRVLVAPDQGGVAQSLVSHLEKQGVEALILPEMDKRTALAAWMDKLQASGPVQGVYWLAGLDPEPALETLDLDEWHDLTRRWVKDLAVVMRSLHASISTPANFLVSATRLGGLHGYGPQRPAGALGGAVTGFTKAFKREQPAAMVKTVDFEVGLDNASLADLLIAETLSDPGIVEAGYRDRLRYSIIPKEQPVLSGAGLPLTPDSVFVVTGAAGGITSAIVADLAASSRGSFYLLDLAPEPDPADPKINLFRTNKEALRELLIEETKATGDRPTPARIEKALGSVERAEAALRAIQAVRAAGGQVTYCCADLQDGAQVAAIVDEIRARNGKIDVLVHAAGVEISRPLPEKNDTQFDLVFDVKADGIFNLLKSARGLPIGAVVAFSSIAGRFGNGGQTDYSAANDLLCKLVASLPFWRNGTRGIAIDWTAWGEIGMATRGSIPRIMEMAGIEMLPTECGIPVVRRELTGGDFSGEVLVAGKLGVLANEWDVNGGLEPIKAQEHLTTGRLLPMVGQVKAAPLHGGFAFETTLDPQVQPFLFDHAMGGTPLLPGVMGIEAFVELSEAVNRLTGSDLHVEALEDVQFQAPFKFYRMEPQTLHLEVIPFPDRLQVVLKSKRRKPSIDVNSESAEVQEKEHFFAQIRLAGQPPEKPVLSIMPPSMDTRAISATEIYQIYFHGPAYRVLEGVTLVGENAVGLMAADLPPEVSPPDTALYSSPRLVELCFQTAGIWEMQRRGRLALPLSIDRLQVYYHPAENEGKRLYALVQPLEGGSAFDAQVVDEHGAVFLSLRGYHTVTLPGSVTL